MTTRKKRIRLKEAEAEAPLQRAKSLSACSSEQEILSRAILLLLWRRLFEKLEAGKDDELPKLGVLARTLFDCTLRLQTLQLRGRELELKNEERLLKIEALRHRLSSSSPMAGGLSPEMLAEVERQLGLL